MGSPQAVAAQCPEGHAFRRAGTGRADDGHREHLRPPGFGRRRSRQQHHLSGPNRCARTRTLRTSSRSVGNAPHGEGFSPVSFLTPRRFTNPPTRTHVRLLGQCSKTGRMESPPTNTTSVQVHSGPPQGRTLRSSTATTANQQAVLHPRLCRCNGLCWFAPRVERRTSLSRSASDRDASPASIRFPPGNFKHSLTLFSKSFSSFPRGTSSLSVFIEYLALCRGRHGFTPGFTCPVLLRIPLGRFEF